MTLLEQWLYKAEEDLGNVQLEPTEIDVKNAIQLAFEILDFVKIKCV